MSGDPDVASGDAAGIFATLCVLHEICEVEESNQARNKDLDILTIALSKNDDQLASLKTIPTLGRPEFFQGILTSASNVEVKRAVTASRRYRDFCAEWADLAKSTEIKSKINDKVLKWFQSEFSSVGLGLLDGKKLGLECKAGNGNDIAPHGGHPGDEAGRKVSLKPTLGTVLKRMLCCCSRPVEEKKGREPKGKEVQIFVKQLNGTIFAVNMNAVTPDFDGKESSGPSMILTQKVEALKNKIHLDKGVPPDLQFLIFRETNLEDDKMLHDYGVLPESTIHLIQLRSVLGVEETVAVTATADRGIKFKYEKFSGLYRWYRDGQQMPDVYMGEFLNGMQLVECHWFWP
jgi:hypothetical protein